MPNLKQPPAKPCREAALALLARRDHAVAELAKKLREKGYENTDIKPALESLQESRLLSDTRYAESRWRYRAEVSRWGRSRIVQELKQAGVAAAVLEAAIEQHREADEESNGEADEASRAWELAQKKFKPLGPPPARTGNREADQTALKKYQSEKNRRLAFLIRRGFAMGVASTAIARLG